MSANDPLRWVLAARCASADPEAWFPRKGAPPVEAVLRVCKRCPVRDDCLEFALSNDLDYGVWGGLTAMQRRRLKKKRRAKDAA